jgi:type II secretory pathway component PulF
MPDQPVKDILAGFERLSADESQQFATVLAELASAGLPLSSGLRAAALEAASGRLARALRRVATQLDEGRSLGDILADPRQPLPPHLAGLLAASLKSGRLGTALAEFFEQQRSAYELRRSAVRALVYPGFLISCVFALYAFFSLAVVGQFQRMFEEFELRLSPWIRATLWAGTTGIWLLIAAVAGCIVVIFALRFVLGAARWQQIMSNAPLLGPIWHWSGVAEATRLLGLLVDHELPLALALALTGKGVSNRDVGQACSQLAREMEGGRSLADSLAGGTRLPPLLAPLVRWGEGSGALAAALWSASAAYEARARRRIEVLRIVLPPLVFIFVGASVAFIVVALFLPLMNMVVGLSM